MPVNPQQLTLLLEAAADNLDGAQATFFRALLDSKVFVPLQPGLQAPKTLSKVGSGEDHIGKIGFATVEYQGSATLPIFTEESFVADWAEAETAVAEQEFQSLLWLLGEDTWLYLNPAQEVGKEITPWEIEQLKKGPTAVDELVAALNEETEEPDLIISPADNAFPEFKNKLLPILQIYPELQEAFLVGIQETNEGDIKPALGVKYAGITEAKRLYLRSELENASKNYLPGHQQLFLVDDLDNPQSSNWKLFQDATPFYIGQRVSFRSKKSFIGRWREKFRSMLSRKGNEAKPSSNN